MIQTVERARGRALARQVAHFRSAQLHPRGELVGGDPRREVRITGMPFQVLVVEQSEKIASGLVVAARDRVGPGQVADWLIGIEGGSLVNGRQEPAHPVGRPLLRVAPRVGNRHVGRQVLVLGPERIADPRADAGKAFEREPGAHVHLAGPVGIGLRRQRMDEAKVINPLGQVGQEIGDELARLSPRPERPGALVQCAVLALERDQRFRSGHRLTVPLDQLWLVIERVEMAHGAGAEDMHNVFGPGRKVGRPRRQRAAFDAVRTGRQQSLLGHERRERNPAHAGGHVGQEAPAIKQVPAGQEF